MIAMTLADAAAAMGAAFAGTAGSFEGVSTDTRTLARGQLFFAIVGDRFDGHDYAAGALAAGAAAVVVARGRAPRGVDEGHALEVSDTRRALGDLARAWRRRCRARVAALTGSNGKTTVKEMLAAIASVSHRVTATRGNLNNDIGVPLTLFRLAPDDEIAVIEMGTNGPGEIRYLTDVAEPDVALVNNCGAAHLERLGSVAGVAREKSAIFAGLGDEGIAVVNADDAYADVCRAAAGAHRVLTFSSAGASADVSARAVSANGSGGSDVTIDEGGRSLDLTVPLPGSHNVSNALAAATVAFALGIARADIVSGLAGVSPTAGRLETLTGPGGAIIVNDAYNANPDSLAAALASLAVMPGRRWLVLGDMGELGEDAPARHRAAGAAAAAARVSRLFTLGPLARLAAETFTGESEHFDDHAALTERLAATLAPDVVVLVKGSRTMRLERVVAPLTEEIRAC